MKKNREEEIRVNSTQENKFNIHCIVRDMLSHWKRAVIVGVATALLAFVFANVTYTPQYTSTTTFVVSAKSSSIGPYADSTQVEKLTETFNAVMNSQILKKMVCEELDMDSFNGTVSISSVENTNLMTVGVTAGSPNDAFRMLNSLIDNYSEVGEDVFGEVVIETFEEPSFPGGPNSVVHGKRMMAYGFAGGFALVMALVAIQSYLRSTVKNRAEIPELLDTTEIATLYHEKKYRNLRDMMLRKKKKLLITEPAVGFGYSETIKKIRTKVLYQMRKKDVKVVGIASTLEGEGKTTVAINLAESMAQRYENVL